MYHLEQAKDLKKKFPEETKGLSITDVEQIWEEYSETFAAGWLIPDKEAVKMVFKDFVEE